MDIARESPDQPEVIALIAELDAYQDALYPPECRHALDLESLKQDNVLFYVARDDTGRAVGCGAVVLDADGGEIKRMYVAPSCRGQGLARRLLRALEAAAWNRGCKRFALETGPRQPEALGLYASLGYERCGPYGHYTDDPLSVFMQKTLQG
jgi:putative acetyltransferase